MGSFEADYRKVPPPPGEVPLPHAAAIDPGLDHPYLRGLLDGMRCGILCVDRESRIVLLNDLGAGMLDLAAPPEPGTPLSRALPQYPQIARVLEESFGMSHLPNRAELELDSEPGQRKTIGFTLSFVDGGGGAPLGVAMFFKDLTQIEQREEQDRLKDRLAALGQMAASLAHEIRNPLASIEVTCGLLRRRIGGDDASRKLLAKVAQEVRRLNETITSSLEFVRPLTMTFAPAPLGPVLREAVSVAERRRGGPDLRVRLHDGGDPTPFLMDRDRLRQVFENLILNALEALDGRGIVEIDVETREPGTQMVPYAPRGAAETDPFAEARRYAVIRVRDDGPGIPAERRDRIFVPFFTTKEKGSGVGLSMVKKIVDGHRGLIDVDDAKGGGTVFTVRLPMVHHEDRRDQTS